jgi:hypothetical protein
MVKYVVITYSKPIKISKQAESIPIEKCPLCGRSHDIPLPESGKTTLVLGKETYVLMCPDEEKEFKVVVDVN